MIELPELDWFERGLRKFHFRYDGMIGEIMRSHKSGHYSESASKWQQQFLREDIINLSNEAIRLSEALKKRAAPDRWMPGILSIKKKEIS